ncbi:hypothetical protein ANCDUO_12522 [Ancylostoma duodenale]|uniref:Uncharacterized protein n=1 Tax=Ancylostoma duodenale TaxID=51022 RepID=A0A0C2D598_9BILA|nr:hypothetical protein ANCDUO_12522 [Ancylostoma duodenale]
MPTLRSATQTKNRRTSPASSSATKPSTINICPPQPSESTGESVVSQLQALLAEKAPEGLPLLDQLLKILKPDPRELVEAEKRSRSIVLSGVPEAVSGTPAVERQEHTERAVMDILGVLEIETHPVEVYRMRKIVEGTPRLIICVLSASRAYFEALKKGTVS